MKTEASGGSFVQFSSVRSFVCSLVCLFVRSFVHKGWVRLLRRRLESDERSVRGGLK